MADISNNMLLMLCMRRVLWQGAKGKLKAIQELYVGGDNTEYDRLKKQFDTFIKEIEEDSPLS